MPCVHINVWYIFASGFCIGFCVSVLLMGLLIALSERKWEKVKNYDY